MSVCLAGGSNFKSCWHGGAPTNENPPEVDPYPHNLFGLTQTVEKHKL